MAELLVAPPEQAKHWTKVSTMKAYAGIRQALEQLAKDGNVDAHAAVVMLDRVGTQTALDAIWRRFGLS